MTRKEDRLFHAAQTGDLEVLRAALDQGANPELRDNQGYTARDVAAKNGRTSCVDQLDAHAAEGCLGAFWKSRMGGPA